MPTFARLKALPFGRLLMSASATGTIIGVFAADFNRTHIFNDRWTPHARFHTGQTMSLGVVLGFATLYSLWRPGTPASLWTAPSSPRAPIT